MRVAEEDDQGYQLAAMQDLRTTEDEQGYSLLGENLAAPEGMN